MIKGVLAGMILGTILISIVFLVLLDLLNDRFETFGLDVFGNCIKSDSNFNLQGKNYEQLESVKVDFYLVDDSRKNLSRDYFENILKESNGIWELYNLSFEMRDFHIKINGISDPRLTDDDLFDLLNQNLGNNSLINDSIVDVIVLERFKNPNPVIDFFGFSLSQEAVTYLGFPNKMSGTYAIFIRTDVENISWNLAHEFGHLLGHNEHFIPDTEHNLMTNGCNKLDYPIFLNQDQVNIAVNVVKSINGV